MLGCTLLEMLIYFFFLGIPEQTNNQVNTYWGLGRKGLSPPTGFDSKILEHKKNVFGLKWVGNTGKIETRVNFDKI